MKIVHIETLINAGSFPKSEIWQSTRKFLIDEIKKVEHPKGAGKFIIYPESGKKSGEGNGVKPIKDGLIRNLKNNGWKDEEPLNIAVRKNPGKLDAVKYIEGKIIALEWETGNISSSHRALNKLTLGLIKGVISAGILVVPSRDMYTYLTDRVGNYSEIEPYIDLWKTINCNDGILEIFVIEHDEKSFNVPRIQKGTDGRAKI